MDARQLLTVLVVLQGVKCEAWNVRMPQRIVGIEGSCVTVPCSFDLPNAFKPLLNCSNAAVWKKGDILGPNARNWRVVGDLTNQNCTTIFESPTIKETSNLFLFRLNCPNSDLKYTFTDGVVITFQTVAAPPTLAAVSHVTEGKQVTLQCSAMMPCPSLPPSLVWTSPGSPKHEHSEILQTSDGQMMMQSTLTFTASALHHNRTITCSVSYPLTAGGSTEASASHRFIVSYGPRQTAAELNVSGPVSEGRIVTFTCSSDANPPVNSYTWYKDSHGRLLKQGEGEILLLQVTQSDSGLYLCEAHSDRGSQRSNAVSLEVNSSRGRRETQMILPYVVSGAVAALYIVTLALGLYKYRSLSRRLKEVEQKREHIYSDLQTCNFSSDYDQLQQKVKTAPKESSYENAAALGAILQHQPLPT